jgi:DNA-binding PadR family transcriptional regulator
MPNTSEPDPEEHVPLHPLEFRVLLVLMDESLHGYGIAKEIERRDVSLGRIFPTNLYRRLRDMADRGFIENLPVPPKGDQRRQFRITKYGRLVAQAEARRLEALVMDARKQDLLSSQSAQR